MNETIEKHANFSKCLLNVHRTLQRVYEKALKNNFYNHIIKNIFNYYQGNLVMLNRKYLRFAIYVYDLKGDFTNYLV